LGNVLKQILVLLIALVLTGCVSGGNTQLRKETEASAQQKISEGKTTKSEVKKVFGSPLKTTFTDGGLEIWTYEATNLSKDAIAYIPVVNWFGDSASGKKKELVILFDKDIVKRFSMAESDLVVKSGLFSWF
jgi:hypothetical protein